MIFIILKVGHHGSLTSTSDAYIKALKPEYSVIQVGEGNSYNHPRQPVLDILYNKTAVIIKFIGKIPDSFLYPLFYGAKLDDY